MLIAMAGLPGTGKSSLAARLRTALGAVVLGKDDVRSILFPAPVLDYSVEQDDLTMQAIYSAAGYIRRTFPGQTVILDGRTFLRPGQLDDLLALAESLHEAPHVIECVCDDAVAQERLERDLARGEHPARNRTFDLYLALKKEVKSIALRKLVLDTGKWTREECVERCLAYLRGASKPE